jgi:Yip1 domain
MNFIERITGMFLNPDKTTEDIANEPRIKEALIIVGIYALLVMLSDYTFTSHISHIYNIPGISQSRLHTAATVAQIMPIVIGLIVPLLSWPVTTVILHVLAMFFGGKGKVYPQMMTALGYTDVVKIITYIIAIVLFTQLPYTTIEISSRNISSTISATFTSAAYQSAYFKVAAIILLLGVIVSSLMGIFVIKNCEKLTLVRSAIVIGIPLLVYVILGLFGLAIIYLYTPSWL